MKRLTKIFPLAFVLIELFELLACDAHALAAPAACSPSDGELPSGQNPLATVPDIAANIATVATYPSEQQYFVSPQGNDSWSGNSPDRIAGTSDGPFSTIERARDAIRAEKKLHPSIKNGSINLRGGRYQIQQPIIFSSEDSGIRISAFRAEHPELSGATTVTGARKMKGGRFEVGLPNNPGREVFVDGKRQLVAFKPSSDSEGWRAVSAPSGANTFSYGLGDLNQSDLKPGIDVELLDEGRSSDVVSHIVSLDPSTGTATVAPSDHGLVENVDSFRLLGSPNWLHVKGFFAWDGQLRRLTLNPENPAALAKTGIQVPRLHSLIIFRGSNDNAVTGLRFVETSVAPAPVSESAAIVLDHSHNINVSDSQFHNVGQAIRLIGSSENLIARNEITETGSSGIELQDSSERNILTRNSLTGIGRTDKSATAVYLHGTASNRIAENRISDVGRHGIGIDNWDDQTINTGNIVERNKIWKTNLHAFDSGAIEMLGRSRKNTVSIIRYNEIKDVGKPVSGNRATKDLLESGIYLDDFTSGVLVCGNLISGTSLAAVQIHGGSNIVVRGNIALLDRPNASFAFLQGGNPTSGGQRFDFNWQTPTAGLQPAKVSSTSHKIEVLFDNDAVVDGQDRDLFVSRIVVGSHTLSATDKSAQYHVTDGRVLPGQVSMPWNGALAWDVPYEYLAPLGKTSVSIFAWGNPAGGVGAHFVVKIDDVAIGDGFAGAPPSEMQQNVITKNIIYATAPGNAYFKTEQNGAAAINDNNYKDTTGTRQLGAADTNPIKTDPKFVDPLRGDYRLQASSNLWAAGFKDLPCRAGIFECARTPTKNEAVR